ncbi:MAG: hypothetical protein R3308_06355, partial [Thiohalobacterales bacterium]|nr:hypothetical protein [Thiohalobacterales bacterium]
AEKEDCIISIIMDGENAWEYYPDNGSHFIGQLYRSLVDDAEIQPITFSEAVEQAVRELPEICPGSWVYGSFSTWIGDADKNRAWDLLVEAKHEYDKVMASPGLDANKRLQITRQLGICEGSDWFWWFGDYNPSESVQDFDSLFRSQLRRLYQLMDVSPPPALEIPVSHGSKAAHGDSGAMQRNT